MRPRVALVVAGVAVLTLGACTTGDSGPSAESLCLDAVGELQAATQEYEALLESGVDQMRLPDAVGRLEEVADGFSELLATLDEREPDVPAEALDAHELLASGVGMQAAAWMTISDGLRLRDPDMIGDGAEMITLSRVLMDESTAAWPACEAQEP